jgi:peptide deformylase
MKIVKFPDPRLTEVCEPVGEDEFGDELESTAAKMVRTMDKAEGIGLAAPQVGILKRFFVVRKKSMPHTPSEVFVNPEIVPAADDPTRVIGEEGCLSIPYVRGKVERPDRIMVRARDAHGEPFEVEATELLSRVIQHETDHLDGILFISKISDAERSMAATQLKALRAEFAKRARREQAKRDAEEKKRQAEAKKDQRKRRKKK